MTGFLIFTCPACRTIVDYGCMCIPQPPISRLVGHKTVEAAKTHVEQMKRNTDAA